MSEFKQDELALWINTKEDLERQIEEWGTKGEYPPPWLVSECDRCSLMINILKREAKEAGLTENDMLDMEYNRIGGK